MDARLGPDVLAHHVHAVVHQLDGVQRAATVPRVGGAVRRLPEELDGEVVHGAARLVAHPGLQAGVPIERGVEVVEHAGLGHVDLADHRLLRRRAVQTNRPGKAVLLHRALEGDGGAHRPGAEQVVAAPLAGGHPVLAGLPSRDRSVTHAGQRVVLGQDADDGTAATEGGDEGRGHVGHAALHGEALVLQNADQEIGRLCLEQRGLRVVPELHRHQVDLGRKPLDDVDGRLLRGWKRLAEDQVAAGEQGERSCDETVWRTRRHGVAPAWLIVY